MADARNSECHCSLPVAATIGAGREAAIAGRRSGAWCRRWCQRPEAIALLAGQDLERLNQGLLRLLADQPRHLAAVAVEEQEGRHAEHAIRRSLGAACGGCDIDLLDVDAVA